MPMLSSNASDTLPSIHYLLATECVKVKQATGARRSANNNIQWKMLYLDCAQCLWTQPVIEWCEMMIASYHKLISISIL